MEPNAKRVKIMEDEEDGILVRETPIHLVFDTLIDWGINRNLPWMKLRLVSRAWNESICSYLKAKTNPITIREYNDPETKFFLNLFLGRLKWNGEIRLHADTFSKPNFMTYIQGEFLGEYPVTEFTLHYDERLCGNFLTPLHKILKIHSGTLTKLQINRSPASAIKPKPFYLKKFRFASLKELSIDFNEELESVLEQICSPKGNLEILTIQFLPDGSTQPLPSSKFWELVKSVPSLTLSIRPFQHETKFPMETFAQLPLPNLQKLHLHNVPKAEAKEAKEIISQWSSSVEEMIFVNTHISLHGLPIFPKLRLLYFVEEEACHFDPETLPALEEVHLVVPPVFCKDCVPHLGVKRLAFGPNSKSFPGKDVNGPSPKEFVQSLVTFAKLFPKVEKFSSNKFYLRKDLRRFFFMIRRAFPVLKALGKLE